MGMSPARTSTPPVGEVLNDPVIHSAAFRCIEFKVFRTPVSHSGNLDLFGESRCVVLQVLHRESEELTNERCNLRATILFSPTFISCRVRDKNSVDYLGKYICKSRLIYRGIYLTILKTILL